MNATIKIINFKKAYDFTMKPQTCFNFSKNREKSIIFRIGKICYELLTGKPPFRGNKLDQLGDYFIPNYLSIEAINFLNSTLQNSDKFRVSLNDIRKLDFLSKNINDFHFCDFNIISNLNNLNLNIKGIIININNDKDKEDLKIDEKKENNDKKDNNELFEKENPFSNLKESVEIDINKNDEDNKNNKANQNNGILNIQDSVRLYMNNYLKKPK